VNKSSFDATDLQAFRTRESTYESCAPNTVSGLDESRIVARLVPLRNSVEWAGNLQPRGPATLDAL
jgi:hypothetical protein